MREPITTAHLHIARFYRKVLSEHSRPSWRDRIARAPSPFAIDGLVADFLLFGSRYASAKVRVQVSETARVRKAQLMGVLP